MGTHILTILQGETQESYFLRKEDTVWYLGPTGKKPCVRIDIHKADKVGVIDMINYFQYCNTSQTMLQKDGTRTMIKAFLLYMRKRYPSLREFVFNDNSQIPCKDGEVDLAARNLLLNGQTWYMDMGAVIAGNFLQKACERAKRRVGRRVNLAFDEFSKTRGLSASKHISEIQRLYERCYQKESWKTFFKQLYALDCDLFLTGSESLREWLGLFGFPEPRMTHWLFPLELIDEWALTYGIKVERVRGQDGGVGFDDTQWTKPFVYDQCL
jgi:hypothetical protein